jgi:putative transposase
MPNTYTQLYIQFVFAVKFRKAVLCPSWDDRLRHYITAIVQNHGHKMIAINNMPDHLHMLIGLNPVQSLSTLMQIVKGESSEWVNKEKLTKYPFRWQEGYGAFSYAKKDLANVINYIHNQQEHHMKTNFLSEYKQILDEFAIEYNERYLFREMEN